MGGGFALMLAPRRGFAASSVNYGTAPKRAYTPAFLRGSCPVVASYGGKDRTLRGAADRLDKALTAVGVEHDVKVYPGAGHGFINDHEGAGTGRHSSSPPWGDSRDTATTRRPPGTPAVASLPSSTRT